jgi:cell wall-associated NlpC family hydrolase
MKIRYTGAAIAACMILQTVSCVNDTKGTGAVSNQTNYAPVGDKRSDTARPEPARGKPVKSIDNKHSTASGTVYPDSLVAFARTLLKVPYRYASADPSKGFDCSGFITYVFNHFKIIVPRSSVSFTNYGKTISEKNARPGDLILFTGTDSTIRIVGHMGIVERRKNDTLYFIHSSSGRANGVTISPLGKYYLGRFVKTIRVFPDELFEGR